MHTYDFTSLNDVKFSLSMPPSNRDVSVYCVAAPKTGSVLLDNIIRDLCQESGYAYFDLEPQVFPFGFGLVNCPLEAVQLLEKPGYVFGGFRQIWLLSYVRRFRRSPKIFLVRDPRDMLVSYYFSITTSHPMPNTKGSVIEVERAAAAGQNIEEYISAGKADHIVGMMQQMIPQIRTLPDVHVFRYEDVVFDKRSWILQLADILKIKVGNAFVSSCLAKFDIWPNQERPNDHIRQVTPGNYRKHLSDATIAAIEQRFAPAFKFFDYTQQSTASNVTTIFK